VVPVAGVGGNRMVTASSDVKVVAGSCVEQWSRLSLREGWALTKVSSSEPLSDMARASTGLEATVGSAETSE